MLKILSTLSVTGFMLLGLLFADGVVIEDNTPTQLTPGERTLVTLQINKGQVSGFAKLQLEIPEGLKAEVQENKGASFTFSGQKAKFIWMVLPTDQEFSVSYYLEADEDASGDKVITGNFSYIRDNARVDYALNSKTVSLGASSQPIVDNSTDNPTTTTSTATDSSTGVNITRNVTQLSDNEYLVKVTVANAQLDGFAKVMENFAEGYKAEQESTSGATVTMEPRGIKYVWFSPPTTDTFEVSYRLTKEDPAAEAPGFNGSFAYIKDNNPYELAISDGNFNEQIVDNTTPDTDFPTDEEIADNSGQEKSTSTDETPDTTPEEPVVDEPFVEDPIQEEVVETATDNPVTDTVVDTATETAAEETTPDNTATTEPVDNSTVASETEEVDTSITSIPNAETGVNYKVQIAAGPNTVGKTYFRTRHNYAEKFNIENHKGYVKYTTGSHDEYKMARDARERIRKSYNFDGPFVTAYNEGDRITVQEALMITQQKWYQ